jgi:hypothetical protein
MMRRASGISPSTAAELDFVGRVVDKELCLNKDALKSELGLRVLGRGNRLEIRFSMQGARCLVGNAISSEFGDVALREMWSDVLDLVYASNFGLVLIRLVILLPSSINHPSRERIVYCSAKRPSWLPVAL